MTNPSSYDPDEQVTTVLATVTLVGEHFTLSTQVLAPRYDNGNVCEMDEDLAAEGAISFIEGYYGWKVRDFVIDVIVEEQA